MTELLNINKLFKKNECWRRQLKQERAKFTDKIIEEKCIFVLFKGYSCHKCLISKIPKLCEPYTPEDLAKASHQIQHIYPEYLICLIKAGKFDLFQKKIDGMEKYRKEHKSQIFKINNIFRNTCSLYFQLFMKSDKSILIPPETLLNIAEVLLHRAGSKI